MRKFPNCDGAVDGWLRGGEGAPPIDSSDRMSLKPVYAYTCVKCNEQVLDPVLPVPFHLCVKCRRPCDYCGKRDGKARTMGVCASCYYFVNYDLRLALSPSLSLAGLNYTATVWQLDKRAPSHSFPGRALWQRLAHQILDTFVTPATRLVQATEHPAFGEAAVAGLVLEYTMIHPSWRHGWDLDAAEARVAGEKAMRQWRDRRQGHTAQKRRKTLD